MLVSSLIAPRPSTRKRPSVPTNSSAVPPTVDHPLSYWRSLPKESLRLECNTLHLVDTGTIPTLARRIYDYHRHQLPAASHRNRTTDQSALLYVPEPRLIHDSSITFSAPPVSTVAHPAAELPHFSAPPFNLSSPRLRYRTSTKSPTSLSRGCSHRQHSQLPCLSSETSLR